ncbi:hypothetical protein D0466_05100 [Peribacillus glennii]|uniref:Uncharacterized protein n=1 Tax=Peribacillus glennii TaxID=2303991 RepID=A0A372LJ24_9BACI|nr:hypothetical protein D0466_05100 [Peribacillus glennii]
MEDMKYLKMNSFLLLAIIPLSAVGYFFAVYNESLFFLYEWLLSLLISVSIILSIIIISKTQNQLKWLSLCILAFLVQFSELCLFLGPFTKSGFFYLYYIVTFFAAVIFSMTLKKVNKYKILPIILFIFSITFTLYMLLLHTLLGQNLT